MLYNTILKDNIFFQKDTIEPYKILIGKLRTFVNS